MTRRVWRAVVVVLLISIVGCDQSPTATPVGSGGAASPGSQPSGSAPAASGPSASGGAPTPSSGSPTSADLIEADLAAGTIDRPTAILYRVYAVFGDQRLPAKYVSTVDVEDSAALMAARLELDSLPEAIAAELRPFLVRPTDPSSVFYDVRRTAAGPTIRLASWRGPDSAIPANAAPAAVVCNPISGWGYALGVARFKVWGECGTPEDDADIQQVVAMVENYWDAETAFMSREPLADEGAPVPDEWLNDAGGDGRIDFYLVNGCVTRGGPCRALGLNSYAETPVTAPHASVKGVGVWSSYVMIPKALLGANVRVFRASLAHEIFHVLQESMNVDGIWDTNSRVWHWSLEASAKWAEWHFSQIEDNVTPWFDGFQAGDQSLASATNGNPYRSFTWPLFMEESSGAGVVAAMWQAIEGKANFQAVDKAIDQQLTFKDHFREFALRNWNRELGIGDPMDPLHPVPPTSRSEPSGDHAWAETELKANERGNPYVFSEYVLPLYAKYASFKVDPDVGQVILDLSDLNAKQDYNADALVNVKGKGWERRKLKKGKTTWCMDNPDDEIEQFVVVLSEHNLQNVPVSGTWTVESLAEPCLSYEVNIKWTDVYDGIADTFTFKGFIDKLEPELSSPGLVTLSGKGTIEGSRPGWTHCNPGIGSVPSGKGDAILMVSIADDDPASRKNDTASFSGFPDLSAADFGVSTQPFTMQRKGGTLSIKSTGTIGDLCPRSWRGTITATLKVKEPEGNAEGS